MRSDVAKSAAAVSHDAAVCKPRIRVPLSNALYDKTRAVIKEHKLHTVCDEAACPNIVECWSKSHAAFMILGSICTRACRFCNVATGKPLQLDPHEPDRVAEAVSKLNLRHVVVTSVDRDDLEDGGAGQFAATILAIRKLCPKTSIEVLTPDFLRKPGALDVVVRAAPDVFNHNIETVPSLYNSIRPGARYFHSLWLLKKVKEMDNNIFTKSGIMLGLGESNNEVLQVMDDLRAAEVDFMTISQYLKPTPTHAEVKRYVDEDEFIYYKRVAYAKGFLMVSSSALTRSSYHADDDFAKLKSARLISNNKSS